VTAPDVGGVALFSGAVRGVTDDIDTEYLEYEAYVEMAEAKLAEIGAEVRQRWPQTLDVAIVHRIGRLEVGESAVVIAVAAAHREGIFEACAYAIDRIKHVAPIWKKEVTASGDFWVEGPVDETSPPVVEM
jgi:molybdopterin synthase catalytic subunit